MTKYNETLVKQMQNTLNDLLAVEVEVSEYLEQVAVQNSENQHIMTALRGRLLALTVKLQALKANTIIL